MWAFGNHRCKPYDGIFTMKAILHANHMSMLDQEVVIALAQCCIIRILNEPVVFWMQFRTIRRDNEPIMV